MINEMLLNHKFQFCSFCSVYHSARAGGNIIINNDSHIIHITRGAANVIVENEKRYLTRGTVLSIPPEEKFILNIEPDFEMLNIHYKLWFSNDKMFDIETRLPYVFNPEYFDHTENMLRQMKILLEKNEKYKIAPLAHELILNHITSNKLLPRFNSSIIDKRIMYVYNRLQSRDYCKYSAVELAEYCFLSVSQMNRIFKRIYKISPMKFWENHRFANICFELKNYNNSISRVAEIFGFEDHAYFSRWFKKIAGVPPTEYRKRIENINF